MELLESVVIAPDDFGGKLRLLAFGFVSILLLVTTTAQACPLIDRLVDFNCNNHHKIVVTGDSIVRGFGDVGGDKNGYVRRLEPSFPESEISNVGVSGITSGRLLSAFKRELRLKKGITQNLVKNADLLIIDVGRNDYWQRQPVSFTVRNIRRLVKLFEKKIGTQPGSPPLIVVSTLIPTKRGFQAPFINELNRQLLAMSSKRFQVALRFDQTNPDLADDGLHPTPKGYTQLSKFVKKFVRGKAQKLSRAQRPDRDNDHVYDFFELHRYGTSSSLKDTDGDTLKDGDEIFEYETDPLSVDTDTDEVSDDLEIANGTNPLDADSK